MIKKKNENVLGTECVKYIRNSGDSLSSKKIVDEHFA